MTRPSRARRRDPRLFRGDIVQRLTELQREGVIAGYQLPPREPGEVEVAEIAVRVPDSTDPVSALTTVSAILCELPQFEELGGNIVLDRSPP
jgi:hypothetical protein